MMSPLGSNLTRILPSANDSASPGSGGINTAEAYPPLWITHAFWAFNHAFSLANWFSDLAYNEMKLWDEQLTNSLHMTPLGKKSVPSSMC